MSIPQLFERNESGQGRVWDHRCAKFRKFTGPTLSQLDRLTCRVGTLSGLVVRAALRAFAMTIPRRLPRRHFICARFFLGNVVRYDNPKTSPKRLRRKCRLGKRFFPKKLPEMTVILGSFLGENQFPRRHLNISRPITSTQGSCRGSRHFPP